MKRKFWWQSKQASPLTQQAYQQHYYQSLSDEALCQLYRNSLEQEIIVELLDRYNRYLIHLTLPFLHILGSVADYKTDLFLLLQHSLQTSEPKVFKHWLGRVARNRMYDQVKKRRPEIREELPERKEELENAWDFDLDFAEVLEAIEELKPDQRLYIEMAFFLGYKQREIREKLGWPEDKPRKVRQNAIRNLRKKLGGEGSAFATYLERT